MKFPEKRFMFTVKDISKACGVSRATLLRMEESGFLTPYYIDPDSGYRYYDADNITQIGQYQLLQELGLTRQEIADFYYQRVDNVEFLKEQRLKLNRLNRLLNGMEIQYDSTKNYIFNFIEMPETVCYCGMINASSIPDQEASAYNLYQNMIKEGYKVNMTERMFFMPAESTVFDFPTTSPFSGAVMCVPVIAGDTADEKIKFFPATYAFSTVVHGNYSVIRPMIENFCREAAKRGLKPTGPMRTVPLIAPCTGEHYAQDDYCYECVLPIEREG